MLSVIYIIVSLIILLLCGLFGFIGGRRNGAFRSLVKLAALVLSVVITVIILLCLREPLANAFMSLFSSKFGQFGAMLKLLSQIPASISLLIVFWLLFLVIRLLMLIPQSIISNRLPRTFEEIKFNDQQPTPAALSSEQTFDDIPSTQPDEFTYSPLSDQSDANLTESNPSLSTSEPISPFAQEEPPLPERKGLKILWNVSSPVCGILSSLLLLGAVLMPVSGTVVRVGDALYRVTDAIQQEKPGMIVGQISNHAEMLSNAPLFTVTDFFYGKTVYEPLTTFKSEFGKINLSEEIESAADIACDIIPVIVHLDENGTVNEEDIRHLSACAGYISESELILTVGSYCLNETGSKLDISTGSTAKKMLMSDIRAILTDMEPDQLSEDMETLVSLINALSQSRLLNVLVSEDETLALSDLTNREMLKAFFGILYDNEHTKNLLVSLINLGTETVFKSVGAQPIYSDTDIIQVDRDELIAEADRLCDAIEGIAEFADSLDSENADITTYRLAAAGKALDSLRKSIFFGNQYDAMVRSLTAASGESSESSSLLNALNDALTKCESAERLLNSAQSIAILRDTLQKGESRGRENESLVSSLDILLNHTSPDDAKLLADLSGEYMKEEMIEDFIQTIQTLSANTHEDIETEADAVQIIYDLTDTDSSTLFTNVSESGTITALTQSKIAYEMLSILNSEGRDYGIRSKLTDQNRVDLANALQQCNASETQKQVIAEFFGMN